MVLKFRRVFLYFFLFWSTALLSSAATAGNAANVTGKKVLVVHSYHETQKGHVVEMTQGINEAFSGAGVLVVDKPLGPTSMSVVAVVRRRAGGTKTGHAGTLDPSFNPPTGVVTTQIGNLFAHRTDRESVLRSLAAIEGVYVPAAYDVRWTGTGDGAAPEGDEADREDGADDERQGGDGDPPGPEGRTIDLIRGNGRNKIGSVDKGYHQGGIG